MEPEASDMEDRSDVLDPAAESSGNKNKRKR